VAALNLPTDYEWSDEFGAPTETSFVRATVTAVTHVNNSAIGLRQPDLDILTVEHDMDSGPWPTDSQGDAVTVKFEGTAYWIPGDELPSEQSEVPSEAVPIGTASVSAVQSGDIVGPNVTAPNYEDGFVVWVWSTPQSDYTIAWREDFADPLQVVRVTAPTLSSIADSTIALTDGTNDRVTVTGPEIGVLTHLIWSAFLQTPGRTASCGPDAEVFSTSADPVDVLTPGTYSVASPPQFAVPGRYFWVATLVAPDGTVIAQGRCGEPSETSEVVSFALATNAVEVVADGSAATDTATLVGPTPVGASLRFHIYRQNSGASRCAESDVVAESDSIAVLSPGTYQSEPVVLRSGTYFWVASVYDRNGNVLQTGSCGDPAETTHVIGGLAFTGEVAAHLAPCVLGLIVGLCLVLWPVARRSRRRHAAQLKS
jgi:hypothetical protein